MFHQCLDVEAGTGSRKRHRRRLWRRVLDEFPSLNRVAPFGPSTHHDCALTLDLSLVGRVPGMKCCEITMRFG